MWAMIATRAVDIVESDALFPRSMNLRDYALFYIGSRIREDTTRMSSLNIQV